jgi:hypothetical protein
MSSNEKSIKIIKREERELLVAQNEELPEAPVKTENETRREIFETVTRWIEEQREAQRALSLGQFWQPQDLTEDTGP